MAEGRLSAAKLNTWRDVLACAEWLVEQGYTSPARLAVEGGSHGGILVGRAITERPELFGAAVEQVPVSDAIRSSCESNGGGERPNGDDRDRGRLSRVVRDGPVSPIAAAPSIRP